jgi:PAS domain S-box-containing protein
MMRAILENMQECVAVIDHRGIVLYANPPFLAHFEISGDDFRGEHIRDFITGPKAAYMLRVLSRPSSPRRKHYTIKATGVKRNSGEFPVSCRLTPLACGKRKVFLLSVHDLSGQLEQESLMEQLQHLASIGTFASGVVHEFNNVLTGIRGYATLAGLDLSKTATMEKAFEVIETECLRGSELCRNMSLYTSRTGVNPEPVRLDELVDTVISLQNRFFLQERITVTREIEEMPPLMADRFQIQQVLLNLVINARHAIIPKGSGLISIRARKEKKSVVIEVEDDGTGIDSQSITRIFDPFFTRKGPIGLNSPGKEVKGSGLGLAVSRSIVNKHNGSMTVRSVINQGSCFTVRLPKIFAGSGVPSGRRAEAAPRQIPPRALRVLVVDDEISVREMLYRALTSVSMDVTLARNAEEAVGIFRSERFDVVFLDYILPGMNGDTLVPIIRERLPGAKIVMISGWIPSPVKKREIEKSVHAWIDKPFDVSQIFSCIRRLAPGDSPGH